METQTQVPVDSLREVIETLAPMERSAGSQGERAAAEWLVERFRKAGVKDVVLEEEPTWGGFPPTITALGALSLLGAWKVARGKRRGALLSLVALGGLLDEIQNGPRVVRRTFRSQMTTSNVVARLGDPSAERTIVFLAHHDAAQTGKIFDQSWAKALYKRDPKGMARRKTQIPQWWIGVIPPVLTAFSALTGWKRPARWALGLGAVGLAAVADIGRSPTVPGANDNLSGVATLVGLAEVLRDGLPKDVKVVLASCGAEETLQDGIRAFMERHGSEFAYDKTWFLNYDTVGSPHLLMLEGEGPAWMEEYSGPEFRDLVESCAADIGVDLERGIRARASTDSVIPSRSGYPTATLVSVMPWRLPGNYHLMSDRPEHIDHGTVEDCVRLGRSVVDALAAR